MAILLRSLRIGSAGRELVAGVSLDLAPGCRTALVGASGAGKSLTCAALAGVLPPGLTVSGTLTGVGPDGLATANLLDLPALRRPPSARIALVPQDPTTALHPLTPIGRQVALAARGSGRTSPGTVAQRVAGLLAAVGLDEHLAGRVPGRLSGGQRQRACLAVALAGKPAVLVADEPTTALDVIARAEVLDLLTQVTEGREAPALLLVTHDLPAAMTCEEIVVLAQGEVVERGSTPQVLARPDHPVTRAMCEAASYETLTAALTAVSHGGGPAGGGETDQAGGSGGADRPLALVGQAS